MQFSFHVIPVDNVFTGVVQVIFVFGYFIFFSLPLRFEMEKTRHKLSFMLPITRLKFRTYFLRCPVNPTSTEGQPANVNSYCNNSATFYAVAACHYIQNTRLLNLGRVRLNMYKIFSCNFSFRLQNSHHSYHITLLSVYM